MAALPSDGGAGGAASAERPQPASPAKSVSVADLKEYLHLPAKHVAKELGICLTSLKKLCRQHGIVRWPYRRLKMIDRKIQNMEKAASDGSEIDREVIKHKLEQLHHERTTLPTNYGSGCVLDDFDGTPSSPLSCASTTAAFSDDAVEVDGDSTCFVEVIELTEYDGTILEVESDTTDACAVSAGGSTVPIAWEPNRQAPHGSATGVASGSEHASVAMLASGASAGSMGSVKKSKPPARGHKSASDSVKVELALPPAVAPRVENGGHMFVHQGKGEMKVQNITSDKAEPNMFIPVPAIRPTVVGTSRAQAKQKSEKRKHAEVTLSDEEMIASLAGCASVPATPASSTAASMTDRDLVAALAADAMHTAQPGAIGVDGASGMSDEELAAALAGCAGANNATQSASVAEEMEPWMHASTGSYDEVPQDDCGLELALFDSSE